MSTAGQRRSEGESGSESHVSRQRVYRNESDEEQEQTEDPAVSDASIFRMADGVTATINRSRSATTEDGPGDGVESTAGRVEYTPGPDVSRLSDRYGVDFVKDGQAEKVQRVESEFGEHRVQRWADEGMTVETMGKPRDMQAFRQRQDSRPDAVPSDVERKNQASLQRSTVAQRDTGPAGDTGATDVVRRVVSSPGTSLEEPVQREMESKMGEDFSDVQVHTGPQAAAAAESINARAFTVGRHVAFNEGEYRPETDSGKEVLAHELTHVRQQTDGTVSLLPKTEAEHPGGALSFGDMHVQPKLEVSSPDDPAEKEAERVAEQVMKMDDPAPETGDGPAVQKSPADGQQAEASTDEEAVDPTADLCPRCVRRYAAGKPLNCTECEEKVQAKCSDCEKKKKKLQRSATASEGGEVEGGPEQKIEAVRSSSGEALPDSARSYFEPRFGADFSDVSVHTGSAADEAARSINAEAFTVGSDMAFRSGAYKPESSSGKELLAHELTHVVQQSSDGASPQRTVHRQAIASSLQTHTVREGDTLSHIALWYDVEGGWNTLYEANKHVIDDPHHIEPGWELTIPITEGDVMIDSEPDSDEGEGGDSSGSGGDGGYTPVPEEKVVDSDLIDYGKNNFSAYTGELMLPAQIRGLIEPLGNYLTQELKEDPSKLSPDAVEDIKEFNEEASNNIPGESYPYSSKPVGYNLVHDEHSAGPWEAVGKSLDVGDPGWTDKIPPAPCNLGQLMAYNQEHWDYSDAGSLFSYGAWNDGIFYNATQALSSIFHPGGALDYRSDASRQPTESDFHAQQVFYNGEPGNPDAPIISSGAGAGTPDYACARTHGALHVYIDVAAYDAGGTLGVFEGDTLNAGTYLEYWQTDASCEGGVEVDGRRLLESVKNFENIGRFVGNAFEKGATWLADAAEDDGWASWLPFDVPTFGIGQSPVTRLLTKVGSFLDETFLGTASTALVDGIQNTYTFLMDTGEDLGDRAFELKKRLERTPEAIRNLVDEAFNTKDEIIDGISERVDGVREEGASLLKRAADTKDDVIDFITSPF